MTLGLDFEENGTFLGGNRNSCLVPGLVVRIPSHDLAPPPPPPVCVIMFPVPWLFNEKTSPLAVPTVIESGTS